MASMNGKDSMSPTDGNVHVGGDFAASCLDLVGYMRNYLNGLAQVVAAAFTRNDVFVDPPRGQIIALS